MMEECSVLQDYYYYAKGRSLYIYHLLSSTLLTVVNVHCVDSGEQHGQ